MSSWKTPLISWTEKGLYCASGDFYIDPHRSVDHAILTHAHSDHARRGCRHYYCATSSVGLVKSRLGQNISVQGIPYSKIIRLGEVEVSLHPAGHILGSAQVRIKKEGEVWVVSGDYKRDLDPSCEPFEIVPCDTFITEATFGTPKFIWPKNQEFGKEIYAWWEKNSKQGVNSLLFGYSLGKAQRILAELFPFMKKPILIHESIAPLTECYRTEGRKLTETLELGEVPLQQKIEGELILAPPSLLKTDWLSRLGKFETAFASGWMQGSGQVHGRHYDKGFVMSDHADWTDLNQTILDTGAAQVFVLHRNGALVRHLRKRGIDAHPVDALVPENYSRIASVNLSLL